MTRDELTAELRKLRVPDFAYDLSGSDLSDTYTLRESDGTWFVYYSERGHQWDMRVFFSESEACEYLLDLVRREFTTRM